MDTFGPEPENKLSISINWNQQQYVTWSLCKKIKIISKNCWLDIICFWDVKQKPNTRPKILNPLFYAFCTKITKCSILFFCDLGFGPSAKQKHYVQSVQQKFVHNAFWWHSRCPFRFHFSDQNKIYALSNHLKMLSRTTLEQSLVFSEWSILHTCPWWLASLSLFTKRTKSYKCKNNDFLPLRMGLFLWFLCTKCLAKRSGFAWVCIGYPPSLPPVRTRGHIIGGKTRVGTVQLFWALVLSCLPGSTSTHCDVYPEALSLCEVSFGRST